MIRKILFACIFALVIFILLEFSYRLVVAGPGALNIFNSKALRSYMTLMSSPYIKASEYPEVYFELKPDLDVLLRGVSLRTNSSGLADKEYAVEKPANTYRIAVVGSSWTMPGSVPLEASYHFVLEEELNARGSDMNFEVINFGVEQYGLGEMVGTIRHRVKDYQPDMILMAMTTYTSQVWWDEHEASFDPPVNSLPPFQSMVLLQLGLIDPPVKKIGRRSIEDYSLHTYRRRPQISSAIWQAKQLADNLDAELAFFFLAFDDWYPITGDLLVNTTKMLNVDLINGGKAMADAGGKYKVSKTDLHPNAAGHKVLADELMRYFKTKTDLGLN